MRRGWLLLTLLLLLPAVPGRALWKTLKTPNFVLFYPEEREEQAREVLGELEQGREYVGRVLGVSGGRVAVVLTDLGTSANGLTDPLFRRILLYPYSPSTGELATLHSWWRLLGVHEYTHWAHLDAAAGFPAFLRSVFGNLFAPNLLAPAWLLEGLCVYSESGLSPLEGRLNDGTFEAYLVALAGEEAVPSLPSATFQSAEFPGGTGPYLFGGLFVRDLVETYGAAALREFIQRTSSSPLSYLSPLVPAAGLDRSARKAFGRSFPQLWREWTERAESRAARAAWPERTFGGEPGWIEEPVAAAGLLYYRRSRLLDRRPLETRRVHELLRLDPATGRETVLVRSTAAFTGPLVVRDGRLYYALLDLVPGFESTELSSYGFVARVWQLDLASGRRRQLLRAPVRTFTVLADGALLYGQDRGVRFGSSIRLLPRGETAPRVLLDTELLVAEIESGPEGVFVSARRDGESFAVYRVVLPEWGRGAEAGRDEALSGAALSVSGLAAEQLALDRLLPMPAAQRQLCLASGRLYFSANPDGHYGVYALDLQGGRVGVSDDLTYQSAPAFDAASGKLYGLSLRPGGYILCELPDPLALDGPPAAPDEPRSSEPWSEPPAAEPPGSSEARLEPLEPVKADEEAVPTPVPPPFRRGGYADNLATLVPRVLLPVLSYDTATGEVRAGGALLGLSALGDLAYQLSVFYDSTSGEAELEAAFQIQPALPLQAEVEFATAGGTFLGLQVTSPLVRNLAPGLSYLSAGASVGLFGAGLSRLQLAPLLGLGLRGPFAELDLQLSLPFERVELGSDRDALALTGSLSLEQQLGPLELQAETAWVTAFDGSPWLLPAARGYPDRLPAERGVAGALELWLPVLRVRRGLWNPGLYLEDIYLAAFGDASLSDTLALQMSFGAELHVELRAFAAATGVPADLFARVSVTRERQVGFSAGLVAAGLEQFIRREGKEVAGP